MTMQVILNFHPFCSISYRFKAKQFLHKNGKIAIFTKFRTHDLKVFSPNYEKSHMLTELSIGKIAKFEDASPCSNRDMFWTK